MIQCLFFWGRHTSGCWKKGVYVRWHPGAIRKNGTFEHKWYPQSIALVWLCKSVRDQIQSTEQYDLGRARRGIHCPQGCAMGWGGLYQSWGGLDLVSCSLVWEMRQHKAGYSLFMIRRGKIQRGLWEGKDFCLPCFRQDWRSCLALYSIPDLGLSISDNS